MVRLTLIVLLGGFCWAQPTELTTACESYRPTVVHDFELFPSHTIDDVGNPAARDLEDVVEVDEQDDELSGRWLVLGNSDVLPAHLGADTRNEDRSRSHAKRRLVFTHAPRGPPKV